MEKAVLLKKNPFTDTLSSWPAGCCREKQQNKTKLIIQKAYRRKCLGAFLLKSSYSFTKCSQNLAINTGIMRNKPKQSLDSFP